MLIQASELIAQPGRSGALGQAVTAMREVLTADGGTEWSAWYAATGRPYGTFGLSARRESYTELLDGSLALAMSPAWAEVSATADGLLAVPSESRLYELIARFGEPTPPSQFTVVTTSTLSGLESERAMGWALEVGEHVAKLTGRTSVVATAAAGPMFRVTWISGAYTPGDVDATNATMAADARYLELLAEAGAGRYFVEGSTDRMLLVKLP